MNHSEQKRPMCSETGVDRRVQKTKALLRDALASLVAQKPYDSIVIKEILDRANVGRSTFYAHFSDKDDLLVSSIRSMVESVQSQKARSSDVWHERLLWFSLPILKYHDAHRHDGTFAMDNRGTAILHGYLEHEIAEMISEAVRAEFRGDRADLLTRNIASTFVLVLNWWLERGEGHPEQIDESFRALVLPALSYARNSTLPECRS